MGRKKQRQKVTEKAATTTLRVIAAALLLFGLLLAYGSYRDIARSRAAEGWPAVEAVVTRSVQRRSKLARFAYEYEVDGRRYESNRIGFVYRPFYRATRQYRSGDSVTGHYDPTAPGTAVIRWGVPAVAFLGELVAPIVLLSIGGYLLLVSFRR